MPAIRTIEQADVAGKRVLCRCDFNVPLKDGVVTDDLRIQAALPTIKYLLDHNAKLILMSHLGRPEGTGYEEKFSLKPVAAHLSKLLGKDVIMAADTIGEDAKAKAAALGDGEVLLLENVRFDKREKKNDESFTSELAKLGEVYVNDAFGAAHRKHASTAGLADYLPAYAGYLMEREIATLKGMLDEPKHPFVAILGGSKVSDKIAVIDSLMTKADTILVGGGIADADALEERRKQQVALVDGFSDAPALVGEVHDAVAVDDQIAVARELLHPFAHRGTGVLKTTRDVDGTNGHPFVLQHEHGFQIHLGRFM